jgi:SWI/SNF-related matrix-associated actin-dependent regulator of chromatin subfamily A member 5
MGSYKGQDPLENLKIDYPAKEKTQFSKLEDKFLFCKMAELGYGNWEELRLSVRKSWIFRFDWFLKSRTAAELGRRCDTLLKYVENENKKSKPSSKAGASKTTKATKAGAKTASKGAKKGSAEPSNSKTKKTASASKKRAKATKENDATEPKAKKQKVEKVQEES